MLKAHAATLRPLVDQYETLLILQLTEQDGSEIRQRMDDVAYTLCVSTGTRDVNAALAVARREIGYSQGNL